MQESTTSVRFDHSSIPQRRYRREGDFAQQGWAGASQQRALGSDRHRASQTAAINSLTVYAAKALRAGKRDGSLRGERCREVSPFVVVAPPVKHKAGEGGGSERAGRSRSFLCVSLFFGALIITQRSWRTSATRTPTSAALGAITTGPESAREHAGHYALGPAQRAGASGHALHLEQRGCARLPGRWNHLVSSRI